MANRSILLEEDFSLEFLTQHGESAGWNKVLRDSLGDDGYVLQERIIIPENLVPSLWDNDFRDTVRYARPLVLLGKNGRPVSYQAIIAKPQKEHTEIDRCRGGVKLTGDRLRMLISDPIYTNGNGDETEFFASFNKISKILAAAGMVETDLARTWLYLDDIRTNYRLLNKVRRKYFARVLSMPGCMLPASTGIQGVSHQYSPFSLMFWAISGEKVRVEQAVSPLQCEPTEYAILFSRAVRAKFPLNNLLLISGTASIDEQGGTLYVGDCRAQMERTLTVLAALLQKQGGSFKNIAQAIIYVKREKEIDTCVNLVREAGFPFQHTMVQVADICREELLCEIEAYAVIPNGHALGA